jgi:hypothetical protein
MSKPSSFIMSSEYASVGNDGSGTITVTIPGGTTIASGDSDYTVVSTANIGTKAGGNFRCVASSSKGSGYFYGTAFWTVGKGTAGAPVSSAVPYPTRINIYRTSPTQIVVRATVINTFWGTASLTTSVAAETITVKLFTMVVK